MKKKSQPFYPITKEDLNKLLEIIKQSKSHIHNGNKAFMKARDMLIIKLGAFCGLRPNEICCVRLQDIDFKRRLLFVNGYNNKTKQDGIVALPDVLIMDLVRYMQLRFNCFNSKYFNSVFLFPSRQGDHISRYHLERIFRDYTKEAGINYVLDYRPNGQPVLKYSLYSLRHFCGTETWKATHDLKSVQTMLRHKHIESSEVYVQLDEENKREIANIVFPIQNKIKIINL